RTTDAGAELLQSILRFRKTAGFVEGVVGPGRGVAIVIKRTAVEGVATRSRDCIYEACSPAIDRRVGTYRDLKLLDRIFTALLSGNAHQAGIAVVTGIRCKHRKVSVATPVQRQIVNKRPIQHRA